MTWAKAYLHTKWHLDPSSRLATIDMGRKVGAAVPCPFGGGGAESPCDTVWTRPRPTSVPSIILIHPTVWPQYTNVTDRRQTHRQIDRQTDRQRSDSIGQTVLQTVAQKCPLRPNCVVFLAYTKNYQCKNVAMNEIFFRSWQMTYQNRST